MIKSLLLVVFALVASAEDKPFSWLLQSEQWGSKDESSIQPEGIFNSCGGSIALSSSLQVIQIGSFGPGIRCVWSIAMGTFSTLQVYTDSLDFEVGPSGLSVFAFADGAHNLTRHKIPAGNQLSYSYPSLYVALLTFTSTGIGSGFRLGVRGSGTANYTSGTHHFQGLANGTFKSHTGDYSNNERSSVVVQPYLNYGLEVRVTELDSEPGNDRLTIYTPPAYHTPSDGYDFRQFSGYHPFGPPNSTTNSTEPRFFVLSTDGSITGTGFSLRWNNY